MQEGKLGSTYPKGNNCRETLLGLWMSLGLPCKVFKRDEDEKDALCKLQCCTNAGRMCYS